MTDTLESRFEGLTDIIREAIYQTNNGETIDLGGLDKKVNALVTDVTKASPHQKQTLQRPMAEMIARLDELEQCLNDHKTRLKGKT
jgi:hypothetical protein